MINSAFIPLNQVLNVQLLCEQHFDKPIMKICIEENCQFNPFLCNECLVQNQNHINLCHRQILECQTALVKMAQKLENVAPQSIFAKYFDYFKEFQAKEKEYVDNFNSFIRTQKQKLGEDIDKVKELFVQKIDAFKKEQMDKLDEQVNLYVQNFDVLKRLFNDTLGIKYKQLIKYSNLKTLTKRLNISSDAQQASEFFRELKTDYQFFHQSQRDQKYDAFSYKLQELFLLLNSQSVSPPTYQSGQFNQQTIIQVKHQFDQLLKRFTELLSRNILHFPIKNFNILLQNDQKMLATIRPIITPKLEIQQLSPSISIIGQSNLLTAYQFHRIDSIDTKYVYSSEEENCVTAMHLLGDRILVYALSDSTIRFRSLRENDIQTDFDLMQMKTQILSIESLQILMDDDQDETEVKRTRKPSTKLMKKSQTIEEDISNKPKENYLLAFGGEDQVMVWKVSFTADTILKNIEIVQVHEYKPAGMQRCTSIMDCQDGRTFICGDWEGQIFVLDLRTSSILFHLDTQTQIIIRLCFLSKTAPGPLKRVRFASASRCDMELGGITIWDLQYEDNKIRNCVMEKRIPISKVVKILPLRQSQNLIVVVDQGNKVYIWDIDRNSLVKSMMGGESGIIDLIAIEQQSDPSSFNLTLGLLNSSTLRFVDSHETTISSHAVEDFVCEKCRSQFCSSKMFISRCRDDQFTLIFPRHIHQCRHDTNTQDLDDRCTLKSCFNFQFIKVSHYFA